MNNRYLNALKSYSIFRHSEEPRYRDPFHDGGRGFFPQVVVAEDPPTPPTPQTPTTAAPGEKPPPILPVVRDNASFYGSWLANYATSVSFVFINEKIKFNL